MSGEGDFDQIEHGSELAEDDDLLALPTGFPAGYDVAYDLQRSIDLGATDLGLRQNLVILLLCRGAG